MNVHAINLRTVALKKMMYRIRNEQLLLHSQFLFEAMIRAGCDPQLFGQIRHEWFEAYIADPPVPLDYIMAGLVKKKRQMRGSRKRRWIRLFRRHFGWFYDAYGEKIQAGTWRPPEDRRAIGRLMEQKQRELEHLQTLAGTREPWGIATKTTFKRNMHA